MKTVLVLVALMTFVLPTLANVEVEVAKASGQYDAALRSNNIDALKEVWDKNGTFIDVGGNVLNYEQQVQSMSTLRISSGFSVDQSFRQVGQAVVETGIFVASGTENGKPFEWHHRYTNVWVKKGSKWVVTLEQITDIQPVGSKEDRELLAKEWTEFFVGGWSRESRIAFDGEVTEERGDWTCEHKGAASVASGKTADGGDFVDMMAWDGYEQCLHEFGKLSRGDSWKINFRILSEDKIEGPASGILDDGRKGRGWCTITKDGKNGYKALFVMQVDDGSIFHQVDMNKRK